MDIFASELSPADVGRDLTVSVSGILTGGIIDRVTRVFGLVSVTLDGTTFVLDEDTSLQLNDVDARLALLTEPDLCARHRMMDRIPQRI